MDANRGSRVFEVNRHNHRGTNVMNGAIAWERILKDTANIADALEEQKGALVRAAALEAGFPAKVTSLEVELAVAHLRTMTEEIPRVRDTKPYGTVAAIFPYDAPVVMLARLGGAALLTGNRLRFSFSSWTPRSAAILAQVARVAPALEPVLGQDNREFGQSSVDDERVRVLFISGASAVGEKYRGLHRAFDKLFFAGPGGMPAAIVFPGADPQAASRFIARRAFINGGQYCTTLKKALIHRTLYEEIRDRILNAVAKLKVGDPMDPETDIGPIRVERTRLLVERALTRFEGARRLTGGIREEWITPLVLELEMIPDLELFGPLLALKPFDDPRQAVQELIRTRYGFLAAFFGSPPEEAPVLLRNHFGMVHDNPDFLFTPLRLPFGGRKDSGWILERIGDRWLERDGAFQYSQELARREV
jgi:acyl-CoA reductase-like NAD-dependent aldehyde dehydrogenase